MPIGRQELFELRGPESDQRQGEAKRCTGKTQQCTFGWLGKQIDPDRPVKRMADQSNYASQHNILRVVCASLQGAVEIMESADTFQGHIEKW